MNKTAKDLIYLLSCAVNGITPDKASLKAMDLEQFPETEIVYVKAGLVSQMRHDLDLLKCR